MSPCGPGTAADLLDEQRGHGDGLRARFGDAQLIDRAGASRSARIHELVCKWMNWHDALRHHYINRRAALRG